MKTLGKGVIAISALSFFLIAAKITSNKLQIGRKQAEDIVLEFDKGAGTNNPKIQWDESGSSLQLANDGVTFDNFITGLIVNADVNASAAIDGSKINPVFGAQNLTVDTNVLSVDSTNDRIGMGIASPLVQLHLENANPTIRMRDTDGGATAHAELRVSPGGSLLYDADPNSTGGGNHQFISQGSTAMLVEGSTGNIAIGHTAPSTSLHIEAATPILRLEDTDGSSSIYGELEANAGGSVFLKADPGNAGAGSAMFLQVDGSTLIQAESNGAVKLNLRNINNTSTVCAFAAGTGLLEISACASSLRYKNNVRDISKDEIEKVYQLRGVNFDWKEANGGHNDYGLIAEEVDEIFPQLAPENSEGQVESVNYTHMVGLLVEVVKDQKKQIDELKDRLNNAGL
jgi:hypothetical protein